MPDWLNDPDLTPTTTEPDDVPSTPGGRRQLRKQRRTRWQRNALDRNRRATTPVGFLLSAVVVLIVVYGAANVLPWLTGRTHTAAPPAAETGTAQAPPPATPAADSSVAATESPTPAAPAASPAMHADKALATRWLTGYLTRSNRDDTAWQTAIAPLTTQQLVDELTAAGPDAVGLDQLSRWQVVKVAPVRAVDQPVNTPTRVVLSYAATVTDGTVTRTKPFQLYAYLSDDGRWRVGALDQPYSSEN